MSTYKDNILKIIEGRRNPIAWIEKNIKIVHPARGIIPFELYQFQKNAPNGPGTYFVDSAIVNVPQNYNAFNVTSLFSPLVPYSSPASFLIV